jgi:signal transduction histidine kinase
MMEKSLVKLETFTNDIIASLKNRGGTLLIDIPIKRLIDEILDELRFSPGAENIRFINNLKDEKVLKSDPALIRSIFSNLISNSIKYQDANKDDHFVEISSNSYPMLLEISVKDNGIGISKELHSRIFDSYFTIEKRADSNGLGLSNVKNAVLKLQGAIEVDSIPGEFTTFLVQLPLI